MKVLLVSPLDPDIPGKLKFLMGGENTYTRTLMAYPPKGIKYVHFEQALRSGQIEYLPINKPLRLLVKFRILPLSAGSKCFKLNEKFDLVHCHVYSVKLSDPKVPVVISDSSSNYLFLKYYVHWPWWRIRLGYQFGGWLFKKLGISDPDVNLTKAKRLIVFSKFAFKIHRQLGVASKKMTIVFPGLPKPPVKIPSKTERRIDILFVGVWFERKGGPLVVSAFRGLLERYQNIYLTIVGPVPKYVSCDRPRIQQIDYVPREKLLKDYFSKADIFVISPPRVEGFGFAVLEAMSFGIAVIVSKVCALPELVSDGKTGFVIKPGSVEELTERLEILIKNHQLRKKMGEAARKRFEEKFSIEKSNEELLKVYQQALS